MDAAKKPTPIIDHHDIQHCYYLSMSLDRNL